QSVTFQAFGSAAVGSSTITISATSGTLSHNAALSLTVQAPPATSPAFWPPPGTYSPTQIAVFDPTPNATIYYTTDGSTPTTSSTEYNGPIAINSAVTIKAFAVASGFSASSVTDGTYTVPPQNGAGEVVSIVLTTDDLSRKMEPQASIHF